MVDSRATARCGIREKALGARAEFRILGPLEVVANGQLVALGGAKQRAVLAILLLRAGRVVSRDWLIEQLWDGRPPQSAVNTLYSYVSHLRGALEPQRPRGATFELLVTRTPGYLLRLGPEQLDAAQFEALLQEGSAALEAGDPDRAVAKLNAGLGLWRGPVLAEFADAAFAQGEIARLEELRLVAVETRIEADLALGRHAKLVGELESLIGEHRLRERLRSQLMLALYRSRRQADALRAYQDMRVLLNEQLGIDPSADLKQLHENILRQAPELDWTPPRPVEAPRPPPEHPASVKSLTPGTPPPRTAFVGRDAEFDRLRCALAEAHGGQGRLVLIAGEPGIGKTRIAQELADEACTTGAQVLWGRMWEADGAPAFWPWVQIMRAWMANYEQKRLGQALGSDAPVVGQLIPEMAEHVPALPDPPRLEPAEARFRLFDAVTRVLKRAARQRLLVLVLDDLHQADVPSLRLLQFLTSALGDARILVIGTFRDAKADLDETLVGVLTELGRRLVTRRMRLEGLREQHVASFVELATGIEASPPLVAKLHKRTDGNPLFLNQLVQPLVEDRDPVRFEEELDHCVPQQVLEAVQWRLEQLPEDARTVLKTASVIGPEFSLAVLKLATGLDAGRLVELVEQATALGCLEEMPGAVGQYRFSHALVRDALYNQLSGPRRARLHWRIGEGLEQHSADDPGASLAELAHHFLQAGDRMKALGYLTRAGKRAMALLAYEEAARLFALALDQGPEEIHRCDLLLARGDAQMKAGDAVNARNDFLRAADSAKVLNAPDQLARAALGFGVGLHVTFSFTEAKERMVKLLEDALGALDAGDAALRAQLLGRLAMALYWQPDSKRRRASRERSRTLSQEAVEMARRLGDRRVLASVLRTRCFVLLRPDMLEERLALAAEILSLAEAAGDRETAQEAHMWRIVGFLELGDISTVNTELATYVRIAEELRQPLHLYWAHVWKGTWALMAGRFAEAEQHSLQALGFGQRLEGLNTSELQSGVGGQLFLLRKEQGRLAELEEAVRGFVREFPQGSSWRAALALLHAEVGDEEAARWQFEQLAAEEFHTIPCGVLWPVTIAMTTDVCAFLGDVRRAAMLYELLLPYEERCIVVGLGFACLGSAAHFLGRLAVTMGRIEVACRHFEDALQANERIGAKPYLAHTRYHYARALLARSFPGDRETADALLTKALTTARELGMAPLAQQITSQVPTGPP